jgi:hypothetical protein
MWKNLILPESVNPNPNLPRAISKVLMAPEEFFFLRRGGPESAKRFE